MRVWFNPRAVALSCALLAASVLIGAADLPGHNGPIRALAAAGGRVVSGSFDSTAIIWPEGRVLAGHDGAVNAVAMLADGVATGGADGRVLLWRGDAAPVVLAGHTAPVSALAVSGGRLASASWDGTVRLWAADGTAQVLSGHVGTVTSVAWAPDGTVVSAGYDGTLRIWAKDGSAQVLTIGAPENAVAVAGDGEVAAAGADGTLRLIRPGAEPRPLAVDTTPITALALSPDGSRIAVVSIGGAAVVVDRVSLRVVTVFLGTEHPLWAVAWDGDAVVTGGAGRVVRRWDASSGKLLGTFGSAPPAEILPAGDRGAQVFRACQPCHSLAADQGPRAGPSLHGIFGRRVGTLAGFNYSQALRGMDIVWTPETVARLFEIGPQAMTPGTRMPEQRISDSADRAALIGFLEGATK